MALSTCEEWLLHVCCIILQLLPSHPFNAVCSASVQFYPNLIAIPSSRHPV